MAASGAWGKAGQTQTLLPTASEQQAAAGPSRLSYLMGTANTPATAPASTPTPALSSRGAGAAHWLLKASIPFGSVRGIPIRWHALLFVYLIFTILNAFWLGVSGLIVSLVLYGPILWFTVLIHELGHALTARSLGVEAKEILIWPLGGLAYLGCTQHAKTDLMITLAGPLTHIPMALFWGLILWGVGGSFGVTPLGMDMQHVNIGSRICAGAFMMQLSLFVFNLGCPAYPLDGGRVLVDLLCLRGVAHSRAALISSAISLLVGAAMCIYGLVLTFWYFSISSLTFIGAWIVKEAYVVQDMNKKGTILDHPMFSIYAATQQAAAGSAPARA